MVEVFCFLMAFICSLVFLEHFFELSPRRPAPSFSAYILGYTFAVHGGADDTNINDLDNHERRTLVRLEHTTAKTTAKLSRYATGLRKPFRQATNGVDLDVC